MPHRSTFHWEFITAVTVIFGFIINIIIITT